MNNHFAGDNTALSVEVIIHGFDNILNGHVI
jgi:hypothetical protein